jgi:FtsP/CotA-like multicopper oxidase with cupredoxin domain
LLTAFRPSNLKHKLLWKEKMMNRRQFLTLSSSTAGMILLSQWMLQQKSKSQTKKLGGNYISQNGLLDVDLVATNTTVKVGDQTVNLMGYNGQTPGPKLEVKPGDTVRIRFTNRLSQPSNLHYHGLHILPTGKGDNVFLTVPPGETFAYEFTIPKDHHAGTFWYHPHVHHITANQVFGGLAGLFVVRGEIDRIPEIKAAKEEFLVFQDFALDRNGQGLSPSPMEEIMGREGNVITINGQVNPTLSIPEGGLLRLHFLNASASRFYRLSLEDHPLYLIATDGGGISKPVELQELMLTPGERAEVLIKGEKKQGKYRLLNLPYNRESMGMMGMNNNMMNHGGMNDNMMGHGMMTSQGNSASPLQPLATLVYQGSVSSLPLPSKLVEIEALPQAQTVRRVELSMDMLPGQGMVLLINGENFDMDRVNIRGKLNSIEDWELVNSGSHIMDHNFHLHTHPFQILSRDGQPEPYLAWKDTVLIKSRETVKIRVRFADFPGKTVYHCHILDHEDLGMMGVIAIA